MTCLEELKVVVKLIFQSATSDENCRQMWTATHFKVSRCSCRDLWCIKERL